jgi:hypothetical protein
VGRRAQEKESQPHIDKLKQLIGIELPKGDYELLKDQDRDAVEEKYRSSKAEIGALIDVFKEHGYQKGATYLDNLSQRIFTNIDLWLRTGVIAPENHFAFGADLPGNRPPRKAYCLGLVRCHRNKVVENDHFEKVLERKVEAILETKTGHRRPLQHPDRSC